MICPFIIMEKHHLGKKKKTINIFILMVLIDRLKNLILSKTNPFSYFRSNLAIKNFFAINFVWISRVITFYYLIIKFF